MIAWTRPWAFWFLVPTVGAALLAAAHFRWKSGTLARLGSPDLLKRLADPSASRRQRIKTVLGVAALLCAVLSLAGPRWGRNFRNVRRRGVDVVIAVDVSASMLAEDIAPSRLVEAKRELGLLIEGMEGDRVGIVAFAGAAFLQCPLTLDRSAARSILDLVEPDLIPVPGTDMAAAIRESLNAFPPGSRAHKAVVLLTDGEDHSGRLPDAVKRAEEEGARIFAVGFGSPSGEVIPIRDAQGNVTDYKKDKSGKTVVSRLGEAALQDMASRTGGAYYRATRGEVEIDRLLKDIDGMEKKTLEDRVTDRTRDRFGWPLGLAVLLLFVEFLIPERAGLVALLRGTPLLLLVLFAALPAGAMGRLPEQDAPPKGSRTVRAWRERAAKNPDDPAVQSNLGHALFQAGNAAESAPAFDRAKDLAKDPSLRAAGAYNAGDALAKAGKTDEALERFKEAMRLDPGDADAKHNYEFLLRQKKSGKGKGKPEEKQSGAEKEKPSPAPRKPGQLSKEDADRILQAIERQEKDARRKVKMPASKPATEEDW